MLLMEIMKTSDHSAALIVVPQGVAMDAFGANLNNCKFCSSITNGLVSNANEERMQACLFTSSSFQAFFWSTFLTRRTGNLRVLDSSEDLLLVVAMDAFCA